MAGKTDGHSDSVLNVLRAINLNSIAAFVSLFTVAPTDSTPGTESTYGAAPGPALTRQSVAFKVPEDATPTGRKILNNAVVQWVNWPGTGPETFVAAGLHTLVSAGALIYWADLDTNRTINLGETASFAIDALAVTED